MTYTENSFPVLSPDRLNQMIALASSQRQDNRQLGWFERLHLKSRHALYGLGATAVSFSCIGAFWLVPMLQVQQEVVASDFTISEYLMQDLLEELG